MHQTLIQRYENGCLMLMEQKGEEFHFLGTAFIIHEQGYLLTAAHLLQDVENPVVVSAGQPGQFSHLSRETGASLPVRLAQIDREHDVALLQLDIDEEFGSPSDFIGNPEEIGEGTFTLSMGVPFGHLRIHNVMVMDSMISAKLLSANDTKLLLFDIPVHPGDAGGPLINTEDGRIIGLVQGRFNPVQILQTEAPEDYNLPSRFSYAVSIEYAKPLMEAEGLS
ncbi:MAG: trypsin-like serine protease [Verrucomicrobia bacterium]|jgi:serine protease Do|nr:trypsin-like serine protease [Verrucomicrobiota bacterium]